MRPAQQVYQRLPVWAQNLCCLSEGRRIYRRRYGEPFPDILAEYHRRRELSPAELSNWRDREVSKFVRHAAAEVPYYREKFKEWGIDPQQITGLDDLQSIPVLTKDEVQGKINLFKAGGLAQREIITVRTSGTTGRGLVFPMTRVAEKHQWAVWWRYRQFHGIKFGQTCGVFGGKLIVPRTQTKPPFWRANTPGRQVLFSGYHLRPQNMTAYLGELVRSKLQWLHGYPSQLALLATFILENKITLPQKINLITIGAESLLPQQKRVIERGFQTCVRQHYGLAEAVANISECPHGTLHIDEDFAAVEFQSRGVGGGQFNIIGTNFTNYAFPLLRYQTGDVAVGVQNNYRCGCGRRGRVVEAIDGRVEDYLLLRDGTKVGRLDHIFKEMVRIREAQIYQPASGRIQLRIVRGPEYGERDERRLLDQTKARIGKEDEIEVRYLDTLPRTSSGKLRLVISEKVKIEQND